MAKTSVPLTCNSDKRVVPAEVQVPPLIEVFQQLRDWRKARGKVYRLAGLLVLMLAGAGLVSLAKAAAHGLGQRFRRRRAAPTRPLDAWPSQEWGPSH